MGSQTTNRPNYRFLVYLRFSKSVQCADFARTFYGRSVSTKRDLQSSLWPIDEEESAHLPRNESRADDPHLAKAGTNRFAHIFIDRFEGGPKSKIKFPARLVEPMLCAPAKGNYPKVPLGSMDG